MKLLGLSAGNPGGNAEILLKQALQAAESAGAQVSLVRLEELHLTSGPDTGPDDSAWLWERLLEADGLVVSSPIISRAVPARLKLVVDRLLGPNADAAIVERQLAMERAGEQPAMAFRADERVLKPRVAGFIAVGGAHTPQWKALALPTMHMLTFSMQTAVVDQFVVGGAGTPQSIVLDDNALQRASQLGTHVATQLGRSFEEAEYAGEPGLCPMCHLDVIELHGRAVACATCGATGRLSDDLSVEWTDLTTSVISLDDKRAHFEEILMTAQQHGKVRDTITERAAAYAAYDPGGPAVTAPLHVLVAGGGLAGLATAQGLRKSGHTVEVFERDADLDRKQGYYLHFNPIGGNALQRVLPDDLYELYLSTSRETYDRHESIVLDSQLGELSSRPHMGPPNDGPRPHTGVHRRTLRQVLAGRLGEALHAGSPVVSFEQDDEGVTVTLADGRTARGDLLVGADGIRSAVRTQLLPDVPVIATGIKGIGVYGRTPLTPELDALMPDILNQGVLMAVDQKGARLLIATYRPRRVASEAAKEIAPDVRLDDVPAYVMISCSVSSGTVVPPAAEWTREAALEMQASMLQALEGWHPAARALVEGLDPDSMFAIPFGFLEPAESWEPSRVTVVGDAAHGMLPTLGMGANLSLHDAALLVEAIDTHDDLLAAIGSYEQQMRETAYPILRMTLDHDKNFGGGALAEATKQ